MMDRSPVFRIVAVAMLSLTAAACNAGDSGQNGLEARFRVSEAAAAADIGMPVYPGSKPYKDEDDSSSGANIGISTSLFGFKIVAMKLEATDTPEEVALFYREVLSKYGDVIECKEGAEGRNKSYQGDLECDADESEEHLVYKVGTEKHQRIVAIQPHGNGTRFNLVHLDVRDE